MQGAKPEQEARPGQEAKLGKAPARLSRTDSNARKASEPDAETWPMSVETFLAGDYLRRADIILTRRKGNFSSWLIRWATSSHFSHAALVFLIPYRDKGFHATYVIEADTKGVDLTDLDDYLRDKTQAIAIKRLRSASTGGQSRQWFDEHVQRTVRGRMLAKIKSTYAYGKIFAIALDILRQLVFGVSERVRGRKKAMQTLRKRDKNAPGSFICSGLVQMGYVEALSDLIHEGAIPPTALKQAIFDPDIATSLPDDWDQFSEEEAREILALFPEVWRDELEALEPVDLARSLNLEWHYVIARGWVHRVRSYGEVCELLDWDIDASAGLAEPIGS